MMRLSVVENGHRFSQKIILSIIRVTTGRRAPDILRTLMYRSEFFGKPVNQWLEATMRGSSHWSVAERELFGAFTSHVNRCPF
jgi:hypothetical protein